MAFRQHLVHWPARPAADIAITRIRCLSQPLAPSAAAGHRGCSSTQKNEDVLVPLLVKFLLARPDLTSWSKVRDTQPKLS